MFVFEDIILKENIQLSFEEVMECKRLINDGISRGLSLEMISQDSGIPLYLVKKIDKSFPVEYPDELIWHFF